MRKGFGRLISFTHFVLGGGFLFAQIRFCFRRIDDPV